MDKIKQDEPEFDWLKIKAEIGSVEVTTETAFEKLKRKILENPLVPIGAAATTGCLVFGLYSFRNGERRMSQMMMRARVLAQGFTLVAICGGLFYQATNNQAVKK